MMKLQMKPTTIMMAMAAALIWLMLTPKGPLRGPVGVGFATAAQLDHRTILSDPESGSGGGGVVREGSSTCGRGVFELMVVSMTVIRLFFLSSFVVEMIIEIALR